LLIAISFVLSDPLARSPAGRTFRLPASVYVLRVWKTKSLSTDFPSPHPNPISVAPESPLDRFTIESSIFSGGDVLAISQFDYINIHLVLPLTRLPEPGGLTFDVERPDM
jgi:hypothetical protein